MSPEMAGILIGGIVPALFFGVNGVMSKLAVQTGIGIGPYLMLAGLGVAGAGVILAVIHPGADVSWSGVGWSVLMGLTWGAGVGGVAYALLHYKTPLAILVPLYNMNTLIAVLLALWIFGEWHGLQIVRLLVGAAFIVLGGVLVSGA